MKARLLLPLLLLISVPGLAGTADEVLLDVDTTYLTSDLTEARPFDPFRKDPGHTVAPPAAEKFELGGIVYDASDPVAIVNGEQVGVGDEVAGRTVEKIGKNYIVLRKGDSAIELNLPASEGM